MIELKVEKGLSKNKLTQGKGKVKKVHDKTKHIVALDLEPRTMVKANKNEIKQSLYLGVLSSSLSKGPPQQIS